MKSEAGYNNLFIITLLAILIIVGITYLADLVRQKDFIASCDSGLSMKVTAPVAAFYNTAYLKIRVSDQSEAGTELRILPENGERVVFRNWSFPETGITTTHSQRIADLFDRMIWPQSGAANYTISLESHDGRNCGVNVSMRTRHLEDIFNWFRLQG